MTRAVAAWDAGKAWAYDGATSGTSWLAHRCGLSRSSAAALVRTARRLRSMPSDLGDSVGRRSCRSPKAVLLASAACRSDRTREVFARHEEVLVEHARRLTVDQTALMLQHWLLLADPDRTRSGREGDQLHVSCTFAGATALDGWYDSDDGEVVRAAIAAEYERLWRAEKASGRPDAHPCPTPGRCPCRAPASSRRCGKPAGRRSR